MRRELDPDLAEMQSIQAVLCAKLHKSLAHSVLTDRSVRNTIVLPWLSHLTGSCTPQQASTGRSGCMFQPRQVSAKCLELMEVLKNWQSGAGPWYHLAVCPIWRWGELQRWISLDMNRYPWIWKDINWISFGKFGYHFGLIRKMISTEVISKHIQDISNPYIHKRYPCILIQTISFDIYA